MAGTALAQPAAQWLTPNLESNIERPLRYRTDGTDFVIEKGDAGAMNRRTRTSPYQL